MKNLIVGCGLSGAVIAERLASVGESVTIIDKRPHIGGNVYDYQDSETGIIVHQYGPHIFHTNSKEVWDYLSHFTDWHPFMYRVKAVIDGFEVGIPFNLDSLYKVFPDSLAVRLENKLIDTFGFNKKVPILELKQTEDKELTFLANYVYQKVFLGYNMKQWGAKPEDLDESVSARVPIYISRDNRYFQDKYQAIPANGYAKMVENMLNNPQIEVKLNTAWEDIKNNISYDRLFFTGPIDEYFDYAEGRLPYRSLDIVFKTFPWEYYQSGPQINFPENYDFTRSVEYKYYLSQNSDKTVVSFEYPCEYVKGKNDPYYPVPSEQNCTLYKKYKEKARTLKNTYFLGRLADYKYYNMDQAVQNALNLFKRIRNG